MKTPEELGAIIEEQEGFISRALERVAFLKEDNDNLRRILTWYRIQLVLPDAPYAAIEGTEGKLSAKVISPRKLGEVLDENTAFRKRIKELEAQLQ